MPYEYIKALHIIFVVSWFAGLFYLVRLFVYHEEAYDKPEQERLVLTKQFAIMEKRLLFAITTPAMVVTVLTGLYMAYDYGLFSLGWLHAKLGLVVLLVAYHFHCQNIMNRMAKGDRPMTSVQFRMYNEVATVLLVGIVFLVTVKQINALLYGVGGFVLFAVLVFMILRLIKAKKNT